MARLPPTTAVSFYMQLQAKKVHPSIERDLASKVRPFEDRDRPGSLIEADRAHASLLGDALLAGNHYGLADYLADATS